MGKLGGAIPLFGVMRAQQAVGAPLNQLEDMGKSKTGHTSMGKSGGKMTL